MTDILLTGILHAGLTGIALFLLTKRFPLKDWWLLYLLIVAGYAALFLTPQLPGTAQAWSGRGLVALLSLVFIFTYPSLEKKDYGWTLKINKGSLLQIVLATVAAAVLLNLPDILNHEPKLVTTEKLAYTATLPGIAEELLYRGVLLSLLNKGLGHKFRLAGASMGWGAVVVALLYGMLHGLTVFNHFHVNLEPTPLILTSLSGFFFCWVKERSGSLWPAMVSHNLINLAGLI